MKHVRNPHHISIRCALAPKHTLADVATALLEKWRPEHQFVAKGGFDYERDEKWVET